MRTLILVAASLLASPVLAQQGPARVQPVSVAQAISRASGLQASPDGDGLLGFGAAYLARIRDRGVRFDASTGSDAPPAFVTLSAPVVTRGGAVVTTAADVVPTALDRRASYHRAEGIDERFDIGPDGIELSWSFAQRPAGEGDLFVRYAVETSLGEPAAKDGGLAFEREHGGVSIGKVTGVDGRGERVEGTVQWDGSGVRLSLPAAFVDHATYPIVLDPVLGATIVAVLTAINRFPDAAYDAGTDRWLIAWLRGSAPQTMVMTQLVANGTGALIGNPTVILAPSSTTVAPRVANHGTRGEFGVAATSVSASVKVVACVTVSATTGAVLQSHMVTNSTTLTFTDVGIGAIVEPPVGSSSGFTVFYQSGLPPFSSITAQRVTYLPSGGFANGAAVTLWQGTSSAAFRGPRLSRAAAADGRLLAIAARDALGVRSIVATLLDTGSDTPLLAGDLVLNTGLPTTTDPNVDVDGFGGQWAIAYEALGSFAGSTVVRVRPVTANVTGGTFSVGSGSTFSSGFGGNSYRPAVAFAAGRVWLAYYFESLVLTTSYQRRVVAVDASSCTSCGDLFSVPMPGTTLDPILAANRCIATTTSGGAANKEDALFVWADPSPSSSSPTLLAQRLRDFGTSGTTASLGGACGTTGAVAFNHAPGIGSSGFRCSLTGVPATALAAIFNFSAPSSTFPCGGCVWTPFSVTQSPPIVGGAAFVEFPIPCLFSLVGQQFETQWSVIDFTQTPCGLLAGLTASNRTLLTIGN